MRKIFRKIGIVGAGLLVCAQIFAQPSTLTVAGTSLSRHGYNAAGTATALEATDSVTTGSITKYYVIPDAALNASYTAVLTGSLSSTFTWGATNTSGTAAGVVSAVSAPTDYSAFVNYKKITWSGTGTVDVTAQEVSAASCSGNTLTTPIQVIAAPTAEFTSSTAGSRCVTGTDGSLTEVFTALPIAYTSSVAATRVPKVTYNISCTNGSFTTVSGTVVNATETGGSGPYTATFDVSQTLTHFGLYTITITAVNDRISTKTSVNGTLADVNANTTTQTTYTLLISPTPVSGPMYHVPNN